MSSIFAMRRESYAFLENLPYSLRNSIGCAIIVCKLERIGLLNINVIKDEYFDGRH
jgi:hypothetical protein